MDIENQKTRSNNNKPRRQKGKRPPKKITESYLHNSGLYYLQRFAASTSQFRAVMRRKIGRSCQFHKDQDRAACDAMLEALIEKFTSAGLLNDDSYLRGMVTSLRRRGLSARAVESKLKTKGLETTRIREMLATHDAEETTDGENAEMRAALRLARRRKCGPFAAAPGDGDSARKDHERNLAAFARAGFSYEIAETVLAMKAGDPTD